MSSASGATSPYNSHRSLAGSENMDGDGRPEVAPSKLSRTKSLVKRRKSKGVTPLNASTTIDGDDEDQEADDSYGMLLLNPSTAFDIRSLVRRVKSVSALQRSNTWSAKDSERTAGQRRVRAHEELCLLLPKRSGKGGHNRKAWFMSAGRIGREGGEQVVIATKDASMDAVHAELSLDGDDYLLRDLNSTGGTYLCLSTTNRHHPQRDGYRLRKGDTVVLGGGATIIIKELEVGPRLTQESSIDKTQSLQANLNHHPTDQLALEQDERSHQDNDTTDSHQPSFSGHEQKKCVRFAEILDVAKTDPEAEPMLPTMDGSDDYPLGSRYKRKVRQPREPVYKTLAPVRLTLAITTPELPNDTSIISLPSQHTYTIGSSSCCDIQVRSNGIHFVHARIVFDGQFFLLQDLSFEDNPKRKTRVLLTRATRIGRGDWLLFGTCALTVVNAYRAFRDHEPDLKEIVLKCHMLRTSKRKTRRRESYLPVGFQHASPEPFVVGKGCVCEGQVATAALNVEQFCFQVNMGQCLLTPRFAGINQGMYFLLGRNSFLHGTTYNDDVVRYTSKALMLIEGSIFRIGSSEIEVTFVKSEDPIEAAKRQVEIEANTQLLKAMPWLQQIRFDRHSMENVGRRAQRIDLEAGDSVYDEGDPAAFLFIVVDGDIELSTPLKTSHRRGASIGGSSVSDERRGSVEIEVVVETVSAGSYFGEASLAANEREYDETAKALTPCQLLVLSREDMCGYFASYMDIIRPHLRYETHSDLLQQMRQCVPCCRSISYHELRNIAATAERADYKQDDWILRKGEFTPMGKPRHGVLLLRYGMVDVVTPSGEPILKPPSDVKHEGGDHDVDDALRGAEWTVQSELADASTFIRDHHAARVKPAMARQTWGIDTAIMLLPHQSTSFQDMKARTGVQCFFIDMTAISHLLKDDEVRSDASHTHTLTKPAAGSVPSQTSPFRRRSTNRKSSSGAPFRARHSQVFTSALRAHDEHDHLLENVDLEDANDPSRKWRRKKRNKLLLEETIEKAQQNTELLNALVLYVLSGPNRGDIHVVRNVATIGSRISGADIELNDHYVSPQQAVIEHREGRYWLYDTCSDWGTYVRLEENQSVQIFPGDVFLAGEVEFTCMGSYPERKKCSLCCIQ